MAMSAVDVAVHIDDWTLIAGMVHMHQLVRGAVVGGWHVQ